MADVERDLAITKTLRAVPRTCQACRYWEHIPNHAHESLGLGPWGWCHRLPNPNEQTPASWWCGEYKLHEDIFEAVCGTEATP